jgi:hypothetical protein
MFEQQKAPSAAADFDAAVDSPNKPSHSSRACVKTSLAITKNFSFPFLFLSFVLSLN